MWNDSCQLLHECECAWIWVTYHLFYLSHTASSAIKLLFRCCCFEHCEYVNYIGTLTMAMLRDHLLLFLLAEIISWLWNNKYESTAKVSFAWGLSEITNCETFHWQRSLYFCTFLLFVLNLLFPENLPCHETLTETILCHCWVHYITLMNAGNTKRTINKFLIIDALFWLILDPADGRCGLNLQYCAKGLGTFLTWTLS